MEWKRRTLLAVNDRNEGSAIRFVAGWPVLAGLAPDSGSLFAESSPDWPARRQLQPPLRELVGPSSDAVVEWLTARQPRDVEVTTQILVGPAGVGKTYAAARYLHEVGSGVRARWIDARASHGTAKAVEAFAAAAETAPGGDPWLLIIDDLALVDGVIRLPSKGPGQVLITTQDHQVRAGGEFYEVFPLSDRDGAHFLRANVASLEEATAAELSRCVGGLPAHLSLVGAQLKATSPAAARDLLDELGEFANPERTDQAVIFLLSRSFGLISSGRGGGEVRDLAACIAGVVALAHPFPVQVSWFIQAPTALSSTAERVGEALEGLKTLGLLRVQGDWCALPSHFIRPLRAALSDRDRVRSATALGWLLTWLCPSTRIDANAADLVAPYVLNALKELPDQFVDLVERVSSRADRMADRDTVIELRRTLADRKARLFGPLTADALFAKQRLVVACAASGRLREAMEVGQWVAASQGLLLGGDHPDTLRTLSILVNPLLQAGELDEAVRVARLVYDALYASVGAESAATVEAGTNLAAALVHTGELNEAELLTRKLLATRRLAQADNIGEAFGVQAVLAETLLVVGRFAEADPIAEAVEAGLIASHGTAHPRLPAVRLLRALAQRGQGDLEGAVALCESVAIGLREPLGSQHPDVLNALSTLVVLYGEAERMAGAVALGERVTLALGDTLGAHHPATLRAAVNLLTAYVRAGRHDMACQLGARVTGELCDTLGDDHPEARRSWSALVEACASRGHWLAELALRIDQVERLDRRLGSKAMAPLTARHRLAARMADRGLYRAAVVQQIKVLEGLSSLHDDRQLVTEARAALADFEQGAATERAQVLDIAQVRAIRHAIDVGAVERALFPRSDALV